MLFVSHDRHFLAALSNRVLELTPEGIHQYGGGYTEYVARTGHEAPGLHGVRRDALRHGRACPGHPRLSYSESRRGCPASRYAPTG